MLNPSRLRFPRTPAAVRFAPARSVGKAFILTMGAVVALAALTAPPMLAQSGDKQVSEMLADALTRKAVATLSDGDRATDAGIEASAVLLDLSAELSPNDAELQRLRAELAETRGDTATRKHALARYVQLRPADDAALLELLLMRLLDTQTLDGRLSAIERVLTSSTADSRLSEPLRSRLAWLAAQAAQELGDQTRYVRWLGEAAKLDPANAPAAEATYALLAQRGAGSKALGAAAKNWVEASPVDARARLALASVLASEAAYLDSAQQFANAARFSTDAPLPWSAYRTWAVCVGASGDTRIALDLLTSLEQLLGTGVFGDVASDGGLPVELELVRLTLLGGAQPELPDRDEDAIATSYERVVKLLDADAVGNPAGRQELAWVKALYGDDPDGVEQLLADASPDAPLVRRAMGWVHLRRGDDEEAAWTFERAPDDPICKLGLAILTGFDDPGRARFFRETIRDAPESLAALVTAQMLHRANRPVEPTPEGLSLLDLMQRTPIMVWRMDLQRQPWLEMNAKVRPLDAKPMGPLTLELSIRNASPKPVALGPGQPLRATALINVGLFKEGEAVGVLPTQVVDAHRRLTLAPGERISVTHRLDWRDMNAAQIDTVDGSYNYALSATLDPRVRADGAVTVGPLGTVDAVRGLRYDTERVDSQNAKAWLNGVDSDRGKTRALAIARLAQIGDGPDNALIDPAHSREIAGLLNERATVLPPVWLAWMVYHLDASPQASSFQRVLDVTRRSEDELVRIAHLIGQADGPDHPALDAAERSDLPRLRAFAPLWREVLAGPGGLTASGTAAP